MVNVIEPFLRGLRKLLLLLTIFDPIGVLALFDFDGVLELTVRDLKDTDGFGGVELEPDVDLDPSYGPTILASYFLIPLPVHVAEKRGLGATLPAQVKSVSHCPIVHRSQAYRMVFHRLRLSGVWNYPSRM